MGIVNQAWRDTMALLGQYFTKEERAAGWVESFRPERIAALQRPHLRGDSTGLKLQRAFLDGLNAAVKDGDLPSITKTERLITGYDVKFIGLRPSKRRNIYGQREVEPRDSSTPVYGDKDFQLITTPEFARWLAAQGETPSKHVQAWFDAVGVSAAPWAVPAPAPSPTTQSAPQAATPPPAKNKRPDLLTPLIENAQRQTSDPFDANAIWAKLCTMAEQQIRPMRGVAPDGIKWFDGNDETKFLSLDALRDRLRRQKKATQQPAKAPLKRVK